MKNCSRKQAIGGRAGGIRLHAFSARLARCCGLALVALTAVHSGAATYSWTGAGFFGQDFLWSDNFNWSGGVAPTTNDSNVNLVFPEGYPKNMTNDIVGLTVASISFQGSNYVVSGKSGQQNPINLSSSSLLGFSVSASANNCKFSLSSPLVLNSSGSFSVSGGMTLTVQSAVSGPGGFFKTGPGTLAFNGVFNNTYAGSTTVSDGTLTLDNVFTLFTSSPSIAVPGPLFIGGTNYNLAPVVELLFDSQIATNAPVIVNENGKLLLNTHSNMLGSLTIQGGLVNTGLGTGNTSPGLLTLNGNLTNHYSLVASFGTLSGRLDLGGSPRTFYLDTGSKLASDTSISGSGPANPGITVKGGGLLELFNTTNTYNGPTDIQNGAIQLGGGTQLLGNPAYSVMVEPSGQLQLQSVQCVAQPLFLFGGGITSLFYSGANAWPGTITLNGDCHVNGNLFADNLTLTGVIAGSGDLRKLGIGALYLGGSQANTFTGGLFCDEGYVQFEKPSNIPVLAGPLSIGETNESNFSVNVFDSSSGQVPSTVPVIILQSGTFELRAGSTETLASVEFTGGNLQPDGPDQNLALPAAVVTLAGNVTSHYAPPGGVTSEASMTGYGNFVLPSGTHIFQCDSTAYLVVYALLQGAGAITKTGVGGVTLYNTNTYTGLTTIQQGYVNLLNGLPGSTDSGTVVASGATLSLYGTAVTNESLTLQAGATLSYAFGTNTWQGPISIDTNVTITGLSPDELILSGVISGAGGVVLDPLNTGTVVLQGVADNTYAGATVINSGVLALNKANSIAIPGDMIIGQPNGGSPNAQVLCQGANQFAPATGAQLVTRTLTINPSGKLTMQGYNQQIANLLLRDAGVGTAPAILSLNGDLAVQNVTPGFSSFVQGNLALANTGAKTSHVIDVQSNATLNLPATVSESGGSAALQKNSSGTLNLTGNNTFSGVFSITSGVVQGQGPQAFGTTAGGTIVSDGATLQLAGTTNSEPFTFSGNGAVGFGALKDTGTNVLNGNIVLASNAMLAAYGSDLLNGVISGPGNLNKSGTGTMRFAGNSPNTYGGFTYATMGTLELAKTSSNAVPSVLYVGQDFVPADSGVVRWFGHNQLATNGVLIVEYYGTADLNGYSNTIGSFGGIGALMLGSGTLTAGTDGNPGAFGGVISGNGGNLTKIGGGALTLYGNNTYSGGTTLNGGSLIVNGQETASSITVNGGTLGGTGTVGVVTVLGSGQIDPGPVPGAGILHSGPVNFIGVNTALDIVIAGKTPGVGFNQLALSSLSFMGGKLNLTMSCAGALSNQYVIVTNTGAGIVGGTFSGLAEGAFLTNNGVVFKITYRGGDGNDVALIQQSVVAPKITGLSLLSGGAQGVLVNGSGVPLATYNVQTTYSLAAPVNWATTDVAFADANGLIQYVDSTPVSWLGQQFYRFVAP